MFSNRTQYGDHEVKQLWPNLKSKIPSFFEGICVEPSLLHGDLWSGNSGEDANGPSKYFFKNNICSPELPIFPEKVFIPEIYVP